jgi:hypothetical protein
MISRLTIALPVALLVVTLFAASAPAHAQVRGMTSARAPHTGSSFRFNASSRLVRPSRRHFYSGFPFYPYYDSDYEPVTSEESPANFVVAQPEQPSVPVASPVEALVLEDHDGQWVRIPTGGHLPISSGYSQPQASRLDPKSTGPKEASQSPTKLPPAVLVFRDGHQEEVERYVVQGDSLYTSADYWRIGSWTRRISIAELDVPASVKLNAARGGNFSLPTRPYEVVVRFGISKIFQDSQ